MDDLLGSDIPPIVHYFVMAMILRDFEQLPELFAPDATYWVQGRPPAVPYGGLFPAAEVLPSLVKTLGGFTCYKFNVKMLFPGEDGKSAALMADVTAEGPGEVGYDQNVALIFQLDDEGFIQNLSEYLDNNITFAFFTGKRIPARPIRPGRAPRLNPEVDSGTTQEIVARYISALSSHDFKSAGSLFGARAQTWLNGRPPMVEHGGWMTPSKRLAILSERFARMEDVSIETSHVVVDGPRAAAQISTKGINPADGSVVIDSAALFFVVQNDRITELREYGDHVSIKLK